MCFADRDVRVTFWRMQANERVLRIAAVSLDEQYGMRFRETGEELLRPLPHPIPTQMTQRDDGSGQGIWTRIPRL